MKTEVDVVDGYEPLFNVLMEALRQASCGKGKERHANNKPFIEQPFIDRGRIGNQNYG